MLSFIKRLFTPMPSPPPCPPAPDLWADRRLRAIIMPTRMRNVLSRERNANVTIDNLFSVMTYNPRYILHKPKAGVRTHIMVLDLFKRHGLHPTKAMVDVLPKDMRRRG